MKTVEISFQEALVVRAAIKKRKDEIINLISTFNDNDKELKDLFYDDLNDLNSFEKKLDYNTFIS